ncbi:MAG: D-glycero-beta-D-manno-heptose-7-phosphate kinase [Mariprofundaceae bacterium]|nr:D-glycero-beta-D-manno-heptose-7-phosphate kinase [Mariprofundaceae bacterium]
MILVVGDIIVDAFIWGDVTRISPEAPVPVVNVERSDRRLGGSANVIRNLHALMQPCAMFGVVGDDEPGAWVHERLAFLGVDHSAVLTKKNGRPTAIKTRVIARHQQIVRFDREWLTPLSDAIQQELLTHAQSMMVDAKVLVLSDYAKGVLTPPMIRALIDAAQACGCMVGVDPKPEHTCAYHGASFITPNLQEAALMSGMAAINEDQHVYAMAKHLHHTLDLQWVLITRSECGMTLFDGDCCHHIPTVARDVFDVTGAGDTVIAVFSACLSRNYSALEAATTANQAAGVVVGKVGTATATWEEMQAKAHHG